MPLQTLHPERPISPATGRPISPASGAPVTPMPQHMVSGRSVFSSPFRLETPATIARAAPVLRRSEKTCRTEMLHVDYIGSISTKEEAEKHVCWRRCVKYAFRIAIACAVPLIEAIKAVGFRWAQQGDVEFSAIAPLIFGCLALGATFLLTLLTRHGLHEFRQLARLQYLLFILPSIFRTGLFVGANWALWHGTSATFLVMVMKSSLLPGIFGEMWLTQKKPWITQLWAIAAIMLCIVNYTLSDMRFSRLGLAYSIVASQCDFVGGLLLEAGIRLRLKEVGINKEAEKIRCQFVNEVWKLPVYVALLLAFDTRFVERGVVRGWNAQIVAGAVVTIPFYVAIYNYSCIAVGTLQTNIFSSVDIGVTCILEYLAFGDSITASQGLLISVITLLILIYSTLVVDLRRNAKETLRNSSITTEDDDDNPTEL